MEKIKLILAEDQVLIRKSLISLLRQYAQIQVVGEAGNGRELLDLLKTVETDIVLLDLEMPHMNGREALGIISKRFPAVKVIMLSMYDNLPLVYDLMLKGARGYLPKDCEVQSMIKCITTVSEHGYYFCEKVSKSLLQGSMHQKSINPLREELSLTDREMEVLQLLCDGHTNKEIAAVLNITARTVDFHRSNIYSKTQSSNLARLVRYSIRNGLVVEEMPITNS